MQRMVIIGICGKMGNRIYDFYKDKFEILGVDLLKHKKVSTYQSLSQISKPVDIVVDFSSVDCWSELKYAIMNHIPVLSGTTGYDLTEIQKLEELAKQSQSCFIWKANYAKGIRLFYRLIEESKKEFNHLDFVEIHATTKKDAPSGTAKVLAHQLGIDEKNIQSLRINQAPAIHEIIFSSDEERVILRHEIIHQKAFINGFDEELRKVLNKE